MKLVIHVTVRSYCRLPLFVRMNKKILKVGVVNAFKSIPETHFFHFFQRQKREREKKQVATPASSFPYSLDLVPPFSAVGRRPKLSLRSSNLKWFLSMTLPKSDTSILFILEPSAWFLSFPYPPPSHTLEPNPPFFFLISFQFRFSNFFALFPPDV